MAGKEAEGEADVNTMLEIKERPREQLPKSCLALPPPRAGEPPANIPRLEDRLGRGHWESKGGNWVENVGFSYCSCLGFEGEVEAGKQELH